MVTFKPFDEDFGQFPKSFFVFVFLGLLLMVIGLPEIGVISLVVAIVLMLRKDHKDWYG